MVSLFEFINNKRNIREWRIDMVNASFFSEFSHEELPPSPEQLSALYPIFQGLRPQHFKFAYPVRADDPEKLSYPEIRKRFLHTASLNCPANYSQITILPDGQVTVCDKTYWTPEFIIGDIKTQSLEEVWNSERALEVFHMRDNIQSDSPCRLCGDLKECNQNNNVCYMNVIAAYGLQKYDYPDPNCHNAPKPLVSGFHL